jgi:molybdate transport system regulatory protein
MAASASPIALESAMRLSVRNQLDGKVQSIAPGSVMTIVKVTLKGGHTVTSSVTKEAVADLNLKVGDRVVVLVKSTEVMLGVDDGKPTKKSKKKARKKSERDA